MGLSNYNMAGVITTMQCISMASAYLSSTFQQEANPVNSIFPNSDCEDIVEEVLHPREKELFNALKPSFYEKYFVHKEKPEEFFCLKNDPKEKLLFLSAEASFNTALDPKAKVQFLKDVNEKYDLKYKVFKSFDEMCNEIKAASKIGKLAHVIITGHSGEERAETFKGIQISNENVLESFLHLDRDYSKCFEGLDPSGKIILLSDGAGSPSNDGDFKNNLAQKIANSAKRTVIAPIGKVHKDTKLVKSKDFEVYNEERSFISFAKMNLGLTDQKATNIFKIFHPVYPNCISVSINGIHARERVLVQVVRAEIASKSTLIQPMEADDLQEILSLCEDDPRDKFLFLSMEGDHNGALNPENNPELFEALAKNYDFKFKVVKTYEEFCTQIKEAAKIEKPLHIIVNGHGSPQEIHIAGDFINPAHSLHRKRNFPKCFEGLDSSTKIILLSCKVSEPQKGNLYDNIAGEIAKQTQKIVIAPTEEIYLSRTKIALINPLEIIHYSRNDPKENVFKKVVL